MGVLFPINLLFYRGEQLRYDLCSPRLSPVPAVHRRVGSPSHWKSVSCLGLGRDPSGQGTPLPRGAVLNSGDGKIMTGLRHRREEGGAIGRGCPWHRI